MSVVKAVALLAEFTATSDGNDNAVKPSGYNSTKINVAAHIRASLYVTAGAAGCDFTVLGYRTENAPAETIYVKATTSSAGAILDAENIEGYGFIEIYEDGTATEVQSFYLVCK